MKQVSTGKENGSGASYNVEQLKHKDQHVNTKIAILPSTLNRRGPIVPPELGSGEEPDYDSESLLDKKSNSKDKQNRNTLLEDTQKLTSPGHKSVKFYSPIHQEFKSDVSSISSVPMEFDHEKEKNLIYITPLSPRDVDSLSPSAENLSDKLSSLDVAQSLESLEPTVSQISLSSRVSLPVPLRLGNRETWTSMRPQSLEGELAIANFEDESRSEIKYFKLMYSLQSP